MDHPHDAAGSAVEWLIRTAFDAYNRQDSDALLALVTDDVRWSSESGVLFGKTELRAYWLQQWTTTRTHDHVTGVATLPDDTVRVSLDQVVRSIDGQVVATGCHVYDFRVKGDRIAQLVSRNA